LIPRPTSTGRDVGPDSNFISGEGEDRSRAGKRDRTDGVSQRRVPELADQRGGAHQLSPPALDNMD
jgi:hypothetical protein